MNGGLVPDSVRWGLYSSFSMHLAGKVPPSRPGGCRSLGQCVCGGVSACMWAPACLLLLGAAHTRKMRGPPISSQGGPWTSGSSFTLLGWEAELGTVVAPTGPQDRAGPFRLSGRSRLAWQTLKPNTKSCATAAHCLGEGQSFLLELFCGQTWCEVGVRSLFHPPYILRLQGLP